MPKCCQCAAFLRVVTLWLPGVHPDRAVCGGAGSSGLAGSVTVAAKGCRRCKRSSLEKLVKAGDTYILTVS